MKGWKWVLGTGLGALFLKGCYMVRQPGPVTNFLTGGNEKLANALKRAGADWGRHGLEIANYVTVDDGNAGIVCRFATSKELAKACPKVRPVVGCTHWAMGDWEEMLIDEKLEDDPEGLSYIVQHEMIHALVPKAHHLETEDGIFTPNRTVNFITRADMLNLAKYTQVDIEEVQFLEDVV